MPRNKFLQEFTVQNFLLTHPTPHVFTTSQWSWHPVVYLVYRAAWAIFFIAWIVHTGSQSSVKWFVYLTNWSFLMVTLKTIITSISATYVYFTQRNKLSLVAAQDTEESPNTPWYLQIQWVIYNIANCAAIIVTISYWSLLYKGGSGVSAENFIVHGFNSVYIMIDLCISAMPIRLLHIWHMAIYGLAYIAFTLIYCGAGGTDPDGNKFVYPILDFYGKPVTAVIVTLVILFVALPVTWLFIYGVATLRNYICERFFTCSCINKDVSDLESPSKDMPAVQEQVNTVFVGEQNGGAAIGKSDLNGVVNTAFMSDKY